MKNKIYNMALGIMTMFLFSSCANTAQLTDLKVENLAQHETVAEFLGTRYHRCMGLTSLCPDRCGDSGTLADFRISRYLKYVKHGEYGDLKTDLFSFMTEDNMKNRKINNELFDTVTSLTKGDQVLLSWNHDYVTSKGSSRPERPVTKLEKIADLGSKKWMEQVDFAVYGEDGSKLAVGSDKWFWDISQKTGVIDAEGHGPDLDSHELKQAINWKLFGFR